MFVKALPLVAATFAIAAPLQAQEAGAASNAPAARIQSNDQGSEMGPVTAEMIEDATIVSLQGEYDEGIWNDGAPLGTLVADLTEIGEVEDIILSPDGQVQGVTTDVGGFLGIGQKNVMIPLDDIRLTRAPDSDDITIITRMSDDELQEVPEFTMQGPAGE